MAAARKTPACARALAVADSRGTAAISAAAGSTTSLRSNRPFRRRLPFCDMARRHLRTRGRRQGNFLPLAGRCIFSRRCRGGDGASSQHVRHPPTCATMSPVSFLISQGLPVRPPRLPESPKLQRLHPKTVVVVGATDGLASKLSLKVEVGERRAQDDEGKG